MSEYSIELFNLIQNSNQYVYYKLFVNGVCQLDIFENVIQSNPLYLKQYKTIVTNMELISDKHLLTKKKFNHIRGAGRNDVYEFKSADLRIYVVKQNPNMYIIIGGFKKNQTKDIALLKKRLKDFNF